jgi:uncharacterized membrane protein
MDLNQQLVNLMDNPIAVLVLFPLVLLLLAFIIIPPIFLWRLRYSSLKKALAALLAGNLLLGVILRPLILQSHSADALTFGLLFADFLGVIMWLYSLQGSG